MTTLILKYLLVSPGLNFRGIHIFELLASDHPQEENRKIIVQLRVKDLIDSHLNNGHLWKFSLPFKERNIYRLTFSSEDFIAWKSADNDWRINLESLSEIEDVTGNSESCQCCETIVWFGYCSLHKEKCSGYSCQQRVSELGDYCPNHQNSCLFEDCNERVNQISSYCHSHSWEKQVEVYKGRWENEKEQVARIKNKLGDDLSDRKLEEFKNAFQTLPQVKIERDNRPNVTTSEYDILFRERNNLRINLDTNQQQLNQVRSERDSYQSKWNGSQKELEQRQEVIRQLKNEVKEERLENIAHGEMLERRHLEQRSGDIESFLDIQTKQKELKQLRSNLKNKLDSSQKFLISTLLTFQEQLIRLERINSHLVSLNEKQLQKTKQNLKTKLSDEEINKLCSLQSEITKLEMKLESLQEQLQARIEVNINN
jgi:hypothetical protein